MLLHDYQNVAANSVRTARTPMIHADVIQKVYFMHDLFYSSFEGYKYVCS